MNRFDEILKIKFIIELLCLQDDDDDDDGDDGDDNEDNSRHFNNLSTTIITNDLI